MIRISNWDDEGNLDEDRAVADCSEILASPDNLLWMDIYDSSYEESHAILQDIFGFHPLAIDDALEETHVPKVDDWGDYLYLVCQVINPGQKSISKLVTQEVDIFIGSNYILTYHLEESETIEKVWQRCRVNKDYHQRGPVNILYLLLDETASDFITSAGHLDLTLNNLEDRLFDNPHPSILEEIFSLKRSILDLRQSIGPQREVLNKLARGDYPILGQHSNIYFRDVYDHFIRLYEIIENLRDLTGNTLEIFLSLVNNRMNGIMKTLTIITTLFMPITFLVGFFGMSFFKPALDRINWISQPIFFIVLLAIISFPIGMLIYYYRKGWMR